MKVRTMICVVLTCFMILTTFSSAADMSSSVTIYYTVNDIQIDGESSMPAQKPFILNGTTYVPLRYISEAFGYDVSWDGMTQSIDIMTSTMDSMDDSMDSMDDSMDSMNDMMNEMVTAHYNVMDIRIDGVSNMPSEKPFILDGTTYVPLRYVSEAFGYDVEWEASTKTIKIMTMSMESMNESMDSMIKTFDMKAYQFGFDPAVIEVNKGDEVHLNLTSSDTVHGLSIPEFDVDVRIAPGETQSVTFVADQAGTFEFKCNVYCGSGHSDMKGELVVKE